ncbi:hypothetical protein GCM10009789_26570 [Kribbella sancticallisti]|uniref:Uncharacterized protein n=1 Tax=Kribbella sancticallisti TaxID=460087 RepID=A0ABN2D993_9ACTN
MSAHLLRSKTIANRRLKTLPERWADELGTDSPAAVNEELGARFEHLSRFVLNNEMRPHGEVSDETATAYGDLCVLVGFLADAHDLLTRKETHR